MPSVICRGIVNTVESRLHLSPAKPAGLLLDSEPQMWRFSANENTLTQTKHAKIGEHEEGR